MKYKLKIVPENGGYVGYALLNDEVALTTNIHKDAIMASRELSKLVANEKPVTLATPVPSQQPNMVHSALPPAQFRTTAKSSNVTSRCCGRG